jgi:hypothetical protein
MIKQYPLGTYGAGLHVVILECPAGMIAIGGTALDENLTLTLNGGANSEEQNGFPPGPTWVLAFTLSAASDKVLLQVTCVDPPVGSG